MSSSVDIPEFSSVPQSVWKLRWQRFFRNPLAVLSLAFLVLLTLFCLAAYPLSLYLGINATNTNILLRFQAPSELHWLGRDDIGRDVLLRLMYGGQISIAVGIIATLLNVLIGVGIGVWAGYVGGRMDNFLMRLTDCMIALPLLPILIVLGAVDLTRLGMSPAMASSPTVIFLRIVIIIALVDWTTIARIARAGALSEREKDYIKAARVSGAPGYYNVLVHVLPNIATPLIVAATLSVGRVILLESTLSFLGFGIVPPTPTWGNMLSNAQQLVVSAPHLAIYPGLLIFLTVMAVNFVGDGMRAAFDPRTKE